jgi:molybdopterin-guanine dinucleotide biosynthesis protein A
MNSVSAVILAAGRNARLGEAVPPYYKPLMTVDGKPLITRAIDQVLQYADDITVVASPMNVQALVHVINGRPVHISIQPEPRGPGDALRIGLRTVDHDRTFVLMGDNTFRARDLHKMTVSQKQSVVGIGLEEQEQATRFTRIAPHPDTDKMIFEEGPTISPEYIDVATEMVTVWKGPLILSTTTARDVFRSALTDDEFKIGPQLNYFAYDMELVEVQTEDIGVPEMLP